MKTFIVGLFSLAVLASGAAWGHEDKVNDFLNPENLPALQGFCKANNGIFVFLVDNEGKTYFGKCKELKGPPRKPITKKDTNKPYDKTFPLVILGAIQKTGLKGDPDPCISWTVGGSARYFCW